MAIGGKAIDANYLLAQLKNFDSQVLKNKYNLIFQYETMPAASADTVGKIYQFVGTTNETYTNGYFYKGIAATSEETSETSYSYIPVTQETPEYTIKKDETASEGAAATYHLTKDGVEVGAAIDIPKDFFLTDASIGEVTAADKEAGGKFENDTNFSVGDAYLELDVNISAGDQTTVKPVYINVKNLVDTYIEGVGIKLENNQISVRLSANSGLKFAGEGSNEIALDFETENIDFTTGWSE